MQQTPKRDSERPPCAPNLKINHPAPHPTNLLSLSLSHRHKKKGYLLGLQKSTYASALHSMQVKYENLLSLTWGKGIHLLPGTWPLLIPLRGSGAAPSNLH